jgi:DNA polymerase I-like protein with 3'-5' exonuclease and polymerase domains
MEQSRKIAVVDKAPSGVNYKSYFHFDFDHFHLSSKRIKKLLKKDVDLANFKEDDYDYIVLIGSEACKFIAGITSVTEFAGHLVDKKFIPMISPAMLSFKPEAKPMFKRACEKLHGYIAGQLPPSLSGDFKGITEEAEANKYLKGILEDESIRFISCDTETSALYPRDGYVLGISISHKPQQGVYISTECVTEETERLFQAIFDSKMIVFHNAKFDLKMLEYHFGFKFPKVSDTMLMHYLLDESKGTHGLKFLALKYTEYGDYDKDLDTFRTQYCKEHNLLKGDFSYDLIPFDILSKYAAIDTAVTYDLYQLFASKIINSVELTRVYRELMVPGMLFLKDVEENGVPFDLERLLKVQKLMEKEVQVAKEKLYTFKEVHDFEVAQGKIFNPNSTQQLRILMFDYLKLTPTGKLTGTGAQSTDAEVLKTLAEEHPIPGVILDIRQKSKIKNTYLDKVIPALDKDGRIRTGFNLTSTTSGRLSSSGKLNMQQLPRDNSAVKGCIKANPGYKILQQDLATAEVYVAAVLSKDKALQNVFKSGGDLHSTVAKMVFQLPHEVADIKTYASKERQAAKAITFGIMYGSGPAKVSETVTKDSGEFFSIQQAKDTISQYFLTFKKLKSWLSKSKEQIESDGYIYSILGRKRRLANVFSNDKGIASHEVRSGINFLIQSVASDINLLAGVELNQWIKDTNKDAKIIALVHDSLVLEVLESEVEEVSEMMAKITQKDRGCAIPGQPIGIDLDIGDDYAFGKFEKQYPELL